MLLNLQQRGQLIRLLPQKGSISDLIICKELKFKLLDLSDEHKEKIDYVSLESGEIKFNLQKDNEYFENVEFSESEKYVLKRGVDELDKSESIAPDMLDICLDVKDL